MSKVRCARYETFAGFDSRRSRKRVIKKVPIRLRLTLWYLSVFSIALCCFGLSVYLLAKQRLYREMSEQLETQISSVQHFIGSQKSTIEPDQFRHELQEEYGVEDAVPWLQILDQDGNWVFRSERMQQHFSPPALPQRLGMKERHWHFDDSDYHLLVAETAIAFGGRQYTIETAIPVNGVRRTLRNLQAVFVLLFPAFLVVAAFGSYSVSRYALSPVDDMTSLARSINESNVNRRLPKLQTHDELQRLSDTLNQMLARIESSFARVRQFTADASHELRTPISLIRTEAELSLRRVSRSEEEYRSDLTHIDTESVRTSQLLESLLTLARADSGAGDLILQPLVANELIADIAKASEPLFELAKLQFEVTLPSEMAMVQADETTIRRMIFILLDNARKYTLEGGRVNLRLELESRKVLISVEDNGIGIDAQHLPRIFDRFYRVEKARSRSQGGVGLGLALADWIAKQHHTQITVQSLPGEGSCFAFALDRIADESLPGQIHQGSTTST
jgi:heavy metal sensor kinase